MAKQKEKECNCGRNAGLFIPAGLFLGFGLGVAFNNIPAGMFIGFGAGFAAMAIVRSCCKCNCKK
jgi:hypothetical protein